MLILAEATNQAAAGWAVVGGIVMAGLECLRRLLTWLLFRDRDKADFRREMINEVATLRGEMKVLKTEVMQLTFELALERVMMKRQRELKHYYRGKVGVAMLSLEIYRRLHGRMEEDTFQWTSEDPEPDTASSPLLEEMLLQASRLKFNGDGLTPNTVLSITGMD